MTNKAAARYVKVASGIKPVLKRLAFPILLTYAFLPLSFLIPLLDSTRPPYVDLDTWFALLFYGITETGATAGATLIGVAMVVFLVNQMKQDRRHRRIAAGIIIGVVIIMVGGGAALNESVIKPAFGTPRPNILYLAGVEGSGSLGMTAKEFYALDKEARRNHLRTVLEAEPPPVRMSRVIREHWIQSIGYSFPSGHAYASMFFASFFLALGLTYLSMPRLLFIYLLLPWAVCVSYSRLLLRVHTPTDVSAGGMAGLLLGIVAFVTVRLLMRTITSSTKSGVMAG